MFERRLKIILLILTIAVVCLMVRATQIQLVQHQRWTAEASDLLTSRQIIETTRGRILDRHNRVLAEDDPCIDACVYYQAITDDVDARNAWLAEQAQAWVTHSYGDALKAMKRADRKALVDQRADYLRDQLPAMWTLLSNASGMSTDQIDQTRHAIVNRVEMRRQSVWLQNYRNALAKHSDGVQTPSWLNRWWNDSSSAGTSDFDNFAVDVAEQTQAHVIVPDVDPQMYNLLAKNAERFPALALKPSRHRVYPYGPAGCHILGRLTTIGPNQLKADPDPDDPLRRYYPNDLAGQGGIESLCEGMLRSTRGEIVQAPGEAQARTTDAIAGHDVRLTIDVELQDDVAQAFAVRRATHMDSEHVVDDWRQNQHGAAVVIDVSTNQVLALVSCPEYDPRTFSTEYNRLRVDDLNSPLVNRATMARYEPGSSAKPLMALGALTDGTITTSTTVECTGYLIIDGKKQAHGRCWTQREYGDEASRHKFPPSAPHPTGFLNVTDAITRSCNVFFETVADRMKMDRQRYWYSQFGLGRPTGIGLSEDSGLIPDPAIIPPALLREQTWFSGIGQGHVMATPLQMANAAATIARGGVWMRPHLVADEDMSPINGAPAFLKQADKVNLHFSQDALNAVKLGMVDVVNDKAGTGAMPHATPPDALDTSILVAAKTGTPQAHIMTVLDRDDQGNPIKINGRDQRKTVPLGTPGTTDWYLGDGPTRSDLSHAWFIGFAPADHPQIAFAVFVEFGTRGGINAGGIARDILAACVRRGYLHDASDVKANFLQLKSVGENPMPNFLMPAEPDRPDDLPENDSMPLLQDDGGELLTGPPSLSQPYDAPAAGTELMHDQGAP